MLFLYIKRLETSEFLSQNFCIVPCLFSSFTNSLEEIFMLPVNCLMEPWWIYCTWFNITCILFKEEALSGSSIGSFNCELNGFSIYQNLNMLGLFIIYIFLRNQFTFGFVGVFLLHELEKCIATFLHTHTFSNCGYSPYSNRLI